uniref:FRIGIDA-like protein n=1 Tax=Kalanchoe fedtschenkoi TaxID=63787 RepID=A0A7N0TEX4_KALFE
MQSHCLTATFVSSPHRQYRGLLSTTSPIFVTSALGDEVTNGASGKPELETLCKKMCGKGVRRYMALNLDILDKLREEVPKALSLAPKPAKLMLEAVGKFFLQGSKAFAKNSPMVSGRQAAILVSECYLLSDCGKEMDDEVKTEAESSAVAWRKRLILEGGIPKASELDARGLLLFIGSFGIPSLFKRDDVISLILLSDPREISDALKSSCHIYPKISDWIRI